MFVGLLYLLQKGSNRSHCLFLYSMELCETTPDMNKQPTVRYNETITPENQIYREKKPERSLLCVLFHCILGCIAGILLKHRT